MYRKNEEQMEMITVCGKLINAICEAYSKKELNELDFISKCSFVCGFIYATFGDGGKYESMEASLKLLINTYRSDGGANNEKE